jgi:RNA polymerase sigma-70 factor (ECF subfamily)
VTTHAEDLALAKACLAGTTSALETFHNRHEPDIDVTLQRLGLDEGTAGDVKSTVLEKLLSPPSPKLAQYSGQGPLGAWIKAVATREAMSVRRTAARRRDLLDAAGDALTPMDPELAFLKRHYRDAFRSAFHATVEGLEAEDKLLLRYRFVDALTLPQLAAACGVHRATAARRLSSLRTRLFEGTRQHMTANLEVPEEELESILRLIQSNFEVSMRRLLD